jgi:OPA family sugar phosphate sensor protein UhpC-like MFS transporter
VGLLEYLHQYRWGDYSADCAFAAHRWGWQAAMLTPGIISIVLGLWLTTQLRGTPQEEGLPTVGEWRNDPLELRQEQQSPPMGLWQMLRTTMLQNPMIWLLGASYVLVYLIRIALNDWGNIWLAESHGVNLLSANATVMLFEVGGCWARCSPDGDRICCSAASVRR